MCIFFLFLILYVFLRYLFIFYVLFYGTPKCPLLKVNSLLFNVNRVLCSFLKVCYYFIVSLFMSSMFMQAAVSVPHFFCSSNSLGGTVTKN